MSTVGRVRSTSGTVTKLTGYGGSVGRADDGELGEVVAAGARLVVVVPGATSGRVVGTDGAATGPDGPATGPDGPAAGTVGTARRSARAGPPPAPQATVSQPTPAASAPRAARRPRPATMPQP